MGATYVVAEPVGPCVRYQVTDEQSVADAEQVVHKCLDEQGLKLMAIINNAGIAGRGRQLCYSS